MNNSERKSMRLLARRTNLRSQFLTQLKGLATGLCVFKEILVDDALHSVSARRKCYWGH